jgi:hypothetical protein
MAEGGRMEARKGRDAAATRRLGSRQPSAKAATRELLPAPASPFSLGHLALREAVLMISMDISEPLTNTPRLDSVRSLLHCSNGNLSLHPLL